MRSCWGGKGAALVRALGMVLVMALALPLCSAQQALAQAASPYVPLDDPSYGLVNALQVRGHLPGLSVLERPYTVEQIRRALAALDTAALDRVPRTWARRLARSIAKYDDGRGAWNRRSADPVASGDPVARSERRALSFVVNGGLMLTEQSSGMRELMLADTAQGFFPGSNVRVQLATGPVVAAFRFRGDQALTDDPEYAGFEGALSGSQKGGPGIAGRAEEGYVSLQLPLMQLFAGRMGRNWGPPAYDGLLLGNATWSYDHVAATFGNERVRATWMAARLNDFQQGNGLEIQRWFTARRVQARVFGAELGFSESVVYSGVGRPFEWSLSSPVVPSLNAMYNENESANINFAFDIALPTRVGLFTAQSFVDDVQLDGTTPKPPMYGLTLVADGLRLFGSHRWFASYTEVSNVAYRNTTLSDSYTQNYVSLGRGFTDHREVRVGLDLAVIADATVRPYAAMRWQGTGTYRNPFPPETIWPQLRTVLQGPVMTTARVGWQGTWVTGGAWEVTADVGVNHVTTVNYVPGTSRTAPEGRVRVQWEPGWLSWRGVLRGGDE
jgi:hypothetical protein